MIDNTGPVARELAPAGLRSSPKAIQRGDRVGLRLLRSRAGASSLATMILTAFKSTVACRTCAHAFRCHHNFQCGSELARDSGVSVTINGNCPTVIASKLAPTGFISDLRCRDFTLSH